MFSTTYLSEQGFSAFLLIKNKQSSRLDASDDMRVALSSSINPRISQLVEQMQAQKSEGSDILQNPVHFVWNIFLKSRNLNLKSRNLEILP